MPVQKPIDADWQETLYRLHGHIQFGMNTWMRPQDIPHMFVVGPTRYGKSKFIENFVRQLLMLKGHQVFVMDPGGDLYDDLLSWGCQHRLNNLLLFDPMDRPYIVGYNTTGQATRAADYRAQQKTLATLKAWGQENGLDTPRLSRWLNNTFRALIDSNLTLKEATYLLDLLQNEFRPKIIDQLPPSNVRRDWEGIPKMSKRDLAEQLESTTNRVRVFLESPLRHVFTQQQHSLNFKDILQKQQSIIFRLQPFQGMTRQDTMMTGALLIDDIINETLSRKKSERSHVWVIIDEAADYVTRDIGMIMKEGGKHNLHLVLIGQTLEQFKEDPRVYSEILTNAHLKVAFGGLTHPNLQELVQEFFGEAFDLH